MTSVTVHLSESRNQDAQGTHRRTGSGAALKAWVDRANPKRTAADSKLRCESHEGRSRGQGRRFLSGREAIRWLES